MDAGLHSESLSQRRSRPGHGRIVHRALAGCHQEDQVRVARVKDPVEERFRPLRLRVGVGETAVRQSLDHAPAESPGQQHSDDCPDEDPPPPPNGEAAQPLEHLVSSPPWTDLGALT